MPAPDKKRPVTAQELDLVVRMIDQINQNLSLLSKSLYGEAKTNADDKIGEFGAYMATSADRISGLLQDMRDQLGFASNREEQSD